jgi:hypothetical protein
MQQPIHARMDFLQMHTTQRQPLGAHLVLQAIHAALAQEVLFVLLDVLLVSSVQAGLEIQILHQI